MADAPQLQTQVTGVVIQRFQDRVIPQTNRLARTAALLEWEKFDGQTLTWDIETTGQLAETYAEDAAITNRGSDKLVKANLTEGSYRSAFGITARAAATTAAAGNPSDLVSLFRRNIMNSSRALAAKINVDIFAGSGSDSIIGLVTAVDNAATYATVVPGTDPLWVATEVANGGTVRDLTASLMRQTIRGIVTACGEQPDLIVTTPVLWDKYGELMGTQRRWVDDVRTAAGMFSKMDLGYRALEFDGIPIIADKDATAGAMYFLNTNYLRGRFLPSVSFPNDGGVPSVQLTMGDFARNRGAGLSQVPATGGLVADIIVEGRSRDRLDMFLRAWPQLQLEKRNSSGVLLDLPTS